MVKEKTKENSKNACTLREGERGKGPGVSNQGRKSALFIRVKRRRKGFSKKFFWGGGGKLEHLRLVKSRSHFMGRGGQGKENC